MKKIFLLLIILLLLVGCSSKKEEQKKYELVEVNKEIIIITDDKNVNNNTKISVVVEENNYSNLSNSINKSIAYDISLLNNEEKANIKSNSEVYLKIPEDFDTEKLIVYYVLNNEIKDTFDVEVVEKDQNQYAKFKTNHFSIYVLAELKENSITDVPVVDKNEIKLEEEKPKEENNESSNKNNSTSSLSTINLVGNWKSNSSESYYTFKEDGTGILYSNDTGITVEHTFKWNLNGKKLSISYSEGWLGSISQEIIIYNENKIDIQPRTKVIYNRYYGKIPNNKEYDETLNFKVKYINIPSGLEVADGNSTTEKVRIKTKDANLLNSTYEIIFDLSNCTVNSCNAKPSFDLPSGIEVISSVISKSINMRNKRYYRDVYFDILYVNFSSGYYDAVSSKSVFKATVYAESEEELNNATYQVYIDMKEHDAPGTWNVLAEYFASGKVNLTNEGMSEYVTVTVTEKQN